MVDTEQKMRKKATITEEDVCTLLQRYTSLPRILILILFFEIVGKVYLISELKFVDDGENSDIQRRQY